ncbi:MAG: hypothetical protein AB7U85_05085 [Alphaproteobacteria bacterium]
MPRTLDGNYVTKAARIANEGEDLFNKDELEQAKEAFNMAAKLYKDNGDTFGEAEAIVRCADVEFAQKNLSRASELYEYAKNILNDAEHNNARGDILLKLCETAIEAEDITKAKDAVLSAIEIFKQETNYIGIAKGYDLRASISLRAGQEDSAMDEYKKSANYYHKGGNTLNEALALLAMARICMLLKKNDIAHDVLEKSVVLFRENGDLIGEASSLTGIGILRRSIGDIRNSKKALAKAVYLFEKASNPMGQAEAMLHLARAEAADRDNIDNPFEKAIKNYRKAINLLKITHLEEMRLKAEKELDELLIRKIG